MFPFAEIGTMLLQTLPGVFLDPQSALMFWLVAAMVFFMYSRSTAQELALYGMSKRSPLRETANSIALGLVAGLVGSSLLVLVGIAFPASSGEFLWLWGVALLLAMLNPRLMCFSYSASLISLSHLLFGWPQVHVAAVTGLVAVLHVAESVLIRLHGQSSASPVILRNAAGDAVGGFTLQRYWPVPISLILVLGLPGAGRLPGSVAMPEWWPLLRLPDAPADAVSVLVPVVAAMGYGDLAVASLPGAKASRTARNLLLYSAVLLGLAVLASRHPAWLWAAAIFSAAGHEAVARAGSYSELRGRPAFCRPPTGVRVLDVFPGSPAAQAGLHPGAIVTEVDGSPVASRSELRAALAAAPSYALVTYFEDGQARTKRMGPVGQHEGSLGMVLVPEEDGVADAVLVTPRGLLPRLLGALVRALRRAGGAPPK